MQDDTDARTPGEAVEPTLTDEGISDAAFVEEVAVTDDIDDQESETQGASDDEAALGPDASGDLAPEDT